MIHTKSSVKRFTETTCNVLEPTRPLSNRERHNAYNGTSQACMVRIKKQLYETLSTCRMLLVKLSDKSGNCDIENSKLGSDFFGI